MISFVKERIAKFMERKNTFSLEQTECKKEPYGCKD